MLGLGAISQLPLSTALKVTIMSGAAALAGSATISAAVTRVQPASASMSASAVLVGRPGLLPAGFSDRFSRALSQTAISALPDPPLGANIVPASAAFSASAQMSADTVRLRDANVVLVGSGALAGVPSAIVATAAVMAGNAVVNGYAIRVQPAAATMAASGILVGTPSAVLTAFAAMSASAAVLGTPNIIGRLGGSFLGSAAVAGTPRATMAGYASLNGSASIYANGSNVVFGAALLIGAGSFSINATRSRAASAALLGLATLEGVATSPFIEMVSRPNSRLTFTIELTMWAPADRTAA